MSHAREFCSAEHGDLLSQSTACLRLLSDMREKMVRLRVKDVSGILNENNSEADAKIEKDLLELFSAVDSAIAALKEECIRKLWAHKNSKTSHTQSKRSILQKLDRTIKMLQGCLNDKSCDPTDLSNSLKSARALIKCVEESTSGNQSGHVACADSKRDELAHEFLNSVRSQCEADHLCAWLHGAPEFSELPIHSSLSAPIICIHLLFPHMFTYIGPIYWLEALFPLLYQGRPMISVGEKHYTFPLFPVNFS